MFLHVDGIVLNFIPTQGRGLSFFLGLRVSFWPEINCVCPDACLMWAESVQTSLVGWLQALGSCVKPGSWAVTWYSDPIASD